MSVFRPGLFAGKVALVTGGGSGIGKAITTELLSLGCQVVIASRNIDKLNEATKSLKNYGDVQAIKCNIRQEEDVKSTISRVLKSHGKIDFLVNNGGGQFPSMTHDMSLKGWNAVIETNLTGTFLMSKEIYNQHFKENGGVITNIIALIDRGFPLMGHTGAARAAVQNLTKTMAIEMMESGVRVNAVAPGTIFSQSARDNYAFDVFELARPHIPAKRLGTPEEIASAVCYLLSPAAAYVTGTTLTVDGGSSLYSPPMVQIDGTYLKLTLKYLYLKVMILFSLEHSKMPPYEWIPKSKL